LLINFAPVPGRRRSVAGQFASAPSLSSEPKNARLMVDPHDKMA
jgi:hypothetical protein